MNASYSKIHHKRIKPGEGPRNEPSQIRLVRTINHRLERAISRQAIERLAERDCVRVYRRLRGGQHRAGPHLEHTNLVPTTLGVSPSDGVGILRTDGPMLCINNDLHLPFLCALADPKEVCLKVPQSYPISRREGWRTFGGCKNIQVPRCWASGERYGGRGS